MCLKFNVFVCFVCGLSCGVVCGVGVCFLCLRVLSFEDVFALCVILCVMLYGLFCLRGCVFVWRIEYIVCGVCLYCVV